MSQTWILPTLNSSRPFPLSLPQLFYCVFFLFSHLSVTSQSIIFLYPHQARNKLVKATKKSIQFFCLTEISRPLFIYLFLPNSNIWLIAKYTLLSHFLILSSQTSIFMWLDFFSLILISSQPFILLFLRLIQYQVLISNHIYLVLTNLNLQSYSFLKAADLCICYNYFLGKLELQRR